MTIESISAVTLETADMPRSHAFYTGLGFELRYGGPDADFTSFHVGNGYLNLEYVRGFILQRVWGRIIFYVSDVDAVYSRALGLGLQPQAPPRDAAWGERYFHLRDPDGHELSFARLLENPLSPGGERAG
jgi:catechol 2,3-dioxygenase-like lactoylglutathione lyase family enzyme